MAIDFFQRLRYNGTNLPLASETAPNTHVGAGGTAEHPAATTSVAGFLSAADKTKSDKFTTSSYYWHYSQSSAQSNLAQSPGATTGTKLTFTTIRSAGEDGGGNYSTGTSAFTVPTGGGLFLVGGGLFLSTGVAPNAAQEIRLYASVNDALSYCLDQRSVPTTHPATYGLQGVVVMPTAGAETITLRCYHTLTGTGATLPDTVPGGGITYFWGMLLRAL